MHTDVTRQTFGSILFQFIFFAALLWGCSLRGGVPLSGVSGDIYIPGNLVNHYSGAYPYMALSLSLVLVFVNAFVITRTVSRNLVYPVRSYLPCIFYLLISCGICFPAYDLTAIVAAYLIVCATVAFISSFVRTVSFGTTFRGAFFIGLTPLLEPQNAIYILLVPIATVVFRRCTRETTVAVLGSLFPTLLAAYIYWTLGYGFTGVFESVWQGFAYAAPAATPLFPAGPAGIGKSAAAGIVALTVVLSAFTFMAAAADMRTRAYKIQVFALWFLVVCAVSMAMPSRTEGNFAVMAIPASILAPSYFVRHRGILPLLLYIIMCAAVVTAALLPLLT
ncbi:MAG: hypothetical protein LIO85_08270 [Rikenellaceae bacterium]|nr:hypothetical protein [Rikenellaceae bacterium]